MHEMHKVVEYLIWNAKDKEYDGELCHPSNSFVWNLVDHIWLDFDFK